MNGIWEEIKTEIQNVSPHIAKSFNKPATIAHISKLERELSVHLTESMKSYLATFNGQNHNNYGITFIGGNCLLPVDEIIENYKMQLEVFADEPDLDIPENKIKPRIWTNGWIPLSDFMGITKIVLDLNPGKAGKSGQILQLWAGQDLENEDVVIAESFEEFSVQLLKHLQLKEFEFEDNAIILNDDWII